MRNSAWTFGPRPPSAEDGLVLAATFMPHVIVVDSGLEEGCLRGDQAVAIIKKAAAFRMVKVIGMGLGEEREKMLKAGANLFLEKPFGLEELRQAVHRQAFGKRQIRYTGARLLGLCKR